METVAVISGPLKLNSDPRGLNSKLSVFLNDFNRTLNAVSQYVPYMSETYAIKNKAHRLQIFAQSIRNALNNFGLSIDAKSQNLLRNYFPREIEEDEWLTDMSTKLSRQQSIPSEVIALAYYEYTDDTEGKSNQWSKFQKDPKLMSKLIGVLCKGRLVDVRFLDVNQAPDSQAIHNVFSQLQSFSLEEFRKTYYEIYTELVDHKRNLLQAITDYGLKPEETIKNQILLFVPQQKSRSDWVSELLTKSAELLSVDSVVLSLCITRSQMTTVEENKLGKIYGQKIKSMNLRIFCCGKNKSVYLPIIQKTKT